LKLIAIQVVREDDRTVVALWQLAADEPVSPMHALFVPVALSARPDELTTRLLAIPGFDESAFAAAKAAEERDEPGSFLCWHDPSVDTTVLSLEGPTPDSYRRPSAEDVAQPAARSLPEPSFTQLTPTPSIDGFFLKTFAAVFGAMWLWDLLTKFWATLP
jgi:hypothetical protein